MALMMARKLPPPATMLNMSLANGMLGTAIRGSRLRNGNTRGVTAVLGTVPGEPNRKFEFLP
ncbi:hypothetical protein D3C76_1206610 [compost metagenome]